MGSTHAVYQALQDLNINFRSIIMPEAAKTLQRCEPSVLSTLSSLDIIIEEAGRPLDTLARQLELQLRNAIIGMEVHKALWNLLVAVISFIK